MQIIGIISPPSQKEGPIKEYGPILSWKKTGQREERRVVQNIRIKIKQVPICSNTGILFLGLLLR